MGKKLLLPTDFSKNSLNAIEYAIKLYEHEKCDFYILNIYSQDRYGLDSLNRLDPDDAFNKLSEKRSKQGLGDILTHLTFEDKNPKHAFHVLSRSTLLLDAIDDIIKSLHINMVIMGAKGMTNKRIGKYGKTTLSVIESVRKCPVLVVPRNAIFNHPKEIVLATDFKTDFNFFDVKQLAEIAKLNKSSIQVLSLESDATLNPKQKENKIMLIKYFEDIDLGFNIVHNAKMDIALNCFVKIRKSNMVSYVNKKRTFWERLGFGKHTLGKLGYFENIPVLALNDK